MTDLPRGDYRFTPPLFDAPEPPRLPRPIRVSSLRPLRINSVGLKIIYIVGGWSTLAALNFFVFNHIPLRWVGVLPGEILNFVWMAVAVRSFRGIDEPLMPDRPLWKVTATPPIGYVIAIFMIMALASTVFTILKDPGKNAYQIILGVDSLFWAAVYLNSSIRLSRMNRAATRAA